MNTFQTPSTTFRLNHPKL